MTLPVDHGFASGLRPVRQAETASLSPGLGSPRAAHCRLPRRRNHRDLVATFYCEPVVQQRAQHWNPVRLRCGRCIRRAVFLVSERSPSLSLEIPGEGSGSAPGRTHPGVGQRACRIAVRRAVPAPLLAIRAGRLRLNGARRESAPLDEPPTHTTRRYGDSGIAYTARRGIGGSADTARRSTFFCYCQGAKAIFAPIQPAVDRDTHGVEHLFRSQHRAACNGSGRGRGLPQAPRSPVR